MHFLPSSGSVTLIVNKAATTTALTSTPNPSGYNQSVTFTATVTSTFGGTPTGTVTFTSGTTTLCNTATLSGGVATCAYGTLPAGSDSVTATYSGDSNHAASSGSETQTVNKATTTTVLTSTPNPSTYHQSVTFTATVTGQFGGTLTGTVTFTSGSTTMCNAVTLSSGVATCTYVSLSAGSDSVSAAYSGDTNYAASSGSETQTVNKANSTTTLTSSPNPSSFDQAVTFTATLTGQFGGTPGGSVTFTSGSTTLCSNVTLSGGVATCPYSTLPVGSNSVTATFGGSPNFLTSSGSETQTVDKAATTTAVTGTPNPSSEGQSVTLTATVTGAFGGTPTGSVTFTTSSTTLCGGVALSSGVATCTTSGLLVGSDTITASYSGDPNFLPSSGTWTQTVNKAATTTALTSSPNPSSYSQSVTFTATVTSTFGGTPTGTVRFTSGTTTLCNTATLSGGVATCPYATLPAGSDSVTATYNGDSNHATSSGSETQTVNKATTTTALTSTPNPSNFNQSVTFTATVTGQFGGTPTGTVTFTSGTTTLCNMMGLSAGVATCVYSTLPSGSDLVTASYSGDTNYVGSTSSPLTQTVVAVLVSIAVSPQGLSVAALAMQQYTAEGTYNDGSTQNITSSVAWSSSNTNAATISSGGLATAGNPTSNMNTTITATLAPGTPGTSTLTVYPVSTFFVAPPCAAQPCNSVYGSDTWNGDLSEPNAGLTDGPFASPSRAQYAVEKALQNAPSIPPTVYLRAGTYYPATTASVTSPYVTYPGTLTLGAADSGSSGVPVTWAEYPGDIGTPAAISGGVPVTKDPVSGVGLNLTWMNVSGNLWQVTLPTALSNNVALQNFETLYYNGQRRLRSRIHDNGGPPPNGETGYPSIGYFMNNGVCTGTPSTPAGQPSPTLASCNLGTFLRVVNTVPYSSSGLTCSSSEYAVGTVNGTTVTKCLDRFVYADTSGGDAIGQWMNMNGSYTGNPASPCTNASGPGVYPIGDVELTLIDAWTVDVMRINCVDTNGKVIYLVGPTHGSGTDTSKDSNYNFLGPTVGHRYLIENTLDAFNNAQNSSQPSYGITGIWFLDRHESQWVLNYIANQGENPNTANVVIPQLGAAIPSAPATDYQGAGLLYATNLNYVNFQGITFEMDDFYPNNIGFNNDVNGEYALPQAIDCESCQNVTFNGITVAHTSSSGILIASALGNTPPAATLDTITGSTFYDIGDSGIRIGHAPASTDTSADVVNNITVGNNVIQGYSRVFADGEGIAQGNGNNITYSKNTIADGYHAGISICYNTCGPIVGGASVSGNNISSTNNLISNVIQGVTSDGGALYYNIGGSKSSATGSSMTSNVIANITDSYIMDNASVAGVTVSGSAYGGEGLYLDAQTADVTVENNVVYNLSGHGIHLTEGLGLSTETQNTFQNNIIAFANLGMFVQGTPWPSGCPTSPILQVDITDNIFFFDRNERTTINGVTYPASVPSFSVVGGCLDSCGQAYNTYQKFEGNAYWSTVLDFADDPNAFQVLQTQGLNPSDNACKTPGTSNPTIPMTFNQAPVSCTWQQGAQGATCTNSNGVSGTLPVAIDEDATPSPGTATYQPPFTGSGLSTDTPMAYFFGTHQGPPTPFVTGNTDATITNAGSSLPAVTTVPPTFPNYAYGNSANKF
jgi:hypothetical protein